MPNPYETRRYVDEYLLFHYGKAEDLCQFSFIPRELLRFHHRILDECVLPTGNSTAGSIRALDIGCAVGRFSFELSRVADEVIGIDNSRAFVTAAKKIAKNKKMNPRVHESGADFAKKTIDLPKFFRQAQVRFAVGDAMKLDEWRKAGPYNVVAAINLICRLPSPRRFFEQIAEMVEPGGQFILASPFSWLGSFTPQREWMRPEGVVKMLKLDFRLARERDIPFLIREHRRKFQLVVSKVMTFVRV